MGPHRPHSRFDKEERAGPAPAPWTRVPRGFQGNEAGRQVEPCPSHAAVQAQMSSPFKPGALLPARPGSASAAGAGRDGGKLTPSHAGKLTPRADSLSGFLAKAPLP